MQTLVVSAALCNECGQATGCTSNTDYVVDKLFSVSGAVCVFCGESDPSAGGWHVVWGVCGIVYVL